MCQLTPDIAEFLPDQPPAQGVVCVLRYTRKLPLGVCPDERLSHARPIQHAITSLRRSRTVAREVNSAWDVQGRRWRELSLAEFKGWERQMWEWQEDGREDFLKLKVWKEVRSHLGSGVCTVMFGTLLGNLWPHLLVLDQCMGKGTVECAFLTAKCYVRSCLVAE